MFHYTSLVDERLIISCFGNQARRHHDLCSVCSFNKNHCLSVDPVWPIGYFFYQINLSLPSFPIFMLAVGKQHTPQHNTRPIEIISSGVPSSQILKFLKECFLEGVAPAATWQSMWQLYISLWTNIFFFRCCQLNGTLRSIAHACFWCISAVAPEDTHVLMSCFRNQVYPSYWYCCHVLFFSLFSN